MLISTYTIITYIYIYIYTCIYIYIYIGHLGRRRQHALPVHEVTRGWIDR